MANILRSIKGGDLKKSFENCKKKCIRYTEKKILILKNIKGN